MPKFGTVYVCQQCGYESPRWMGRCPDCDAWNSFMETLRAKTTASSPKMGKISSAISPIAEVETPSGQRHSTEIGELDRVLGGGLMPGSVVLVGGEPGIGKSTLMTVAAHRLSGSTNRAVIYFSGEENPAQLKTRAKRIDAVGPSLLVSAETELDAIIALIQSNQPVAVVVDSIQTVYDSHLESPPGTVSQIRGCAQHLLTCAKETDTAIFLIGHVTKEGLIAGPKLLEHMVDTVLYFEGDRHHNYRLLRAVKNRFGASDELGIFEMTDAGLVEITNPSQLLLSERSTGLPGSAITTTMEGSRPLLTEIQALVTRSFLANPRRVINGLDYNRTGMLLAVLEKRLGFRLGEQDVFMNVTGGVRLVEPATDLAVTLAVASSFRDEPCDPTTVAVGEIGLSGEIRSVSRLDVRLREAARQGFQRAIVPRASWNKIHSKPTIEVVPVTALPQAISTMFGIKKD